MKRSMRRRAGFTVTEIVVTVAILVVLMAVAAPSVIALRRDLKMTELDATAKAIFVAVQDNLTAMRGADTLALLKPAPQGPAGRAGTMGESAHVIYLSSGDARMGLLLPSGTIDPTVANHHYMIKFNQKFGIALEVFYSEEATPEEHWQTEFSGAGKAPARREALVGWYDGGDLAEPDDTAQLPEPILVVHNGEELTASVLVPNWATLQNAAVLTVTVASADGKHSKVYSTGDGTIHFDSLVTGESNDIVLDSLDAGKQFKTLLGGFPPGCDLVLTAELTPTNTGGSGGVTYLPSKSGEARTNSLFASLDATSGTATIAAARHLQNLRALFSGLSADPNALGVKVQSAVQQTAIHWPAAYTLAPIVNDNLKSYDGGGLPIRELRVRGVKNETSVGMFGALSGPVTLKNITLINAKVSAEAGTHQDGQSTPFYQGTLVGSGDRLTVDHCAVYVECLQETADSTEEKPEHEYNFPLYASYGMTSTASDTGGLVGWMNGGRIQNSYAALPYINHDANAKDCVSMGGLVGLAVGGEIENSYAAVDQLGGKAALTAMLVGRGTGGLAVTHSYAVGNISATSGERSGLIGLGNMEVATAEHSYAAVTYLTPDGKPGTGKVHPILHSSGTAADCAFLALSGVTAYGNTAPASALSYEALKTWQDGGSWAKLIGENSFPYKKELLGRNYPFPAQAIGAAANVHRGSWPAEDNLWLTYFEVYTDGEVGLSPSAPPDEGGVPSTSSTLQNKIPVRDGYALVSMGKRSAMPVDYWVPGEGTRAAKRETTTLYSDTPTKVGDQAYYLYVLPPGALQTDYTEGGYQSIQSGGISYWYEPHFAAAVAKTGKTAPTAKMTELRIRTPRHLYNLGRFPAFWGSGSVKNVQQELDVSFAPGAYQWPAATGLTAPPALSPMGSATAAFTGNYTGITMSGNTGLSPVRSIAAARLGATGEYGGLFGVVTGTVKNLSLHLPAGETSFPAGTNKVGLLAAQNGGTLQNCTVYGAAGGSQVTGPDLVAGLTATATGTVTDCAVRPGEGQGYDGLTLAGKRAAGLVGDLSSGGTVERSYAAATVTGETAAAGFALNAAGKVDRSYANCHVTSTGATGSAAGFALNAAGTVTDCYALLTVTGATASGFVSSATGTLTNCYTLADAKDSTGKPAYGFTQPTSGGKLINCRYLDRGYTGNQPGTKSVPADLTAAKLGTHWTDDNGGSSFPFAQALKKQAYPYARVSGLPHVGDWPSMPQAAVGLVYFETYDGINNSESGTFGFYGLDGENRYYDDLAGNERNILTTGYGFLLPNGEALPEIRVLSSVVETPFLNGVSIPGGRTLYPFSKSMYDKLSSGYYNAHAVLAVGGRSYSISPAFAAAITLVDAAPAMGSRERPLQVRTQDQLNAVGANTTLEYMKQTHNIPITKADAWTSLDASQGGKRTFDGDGNQISGLTKPLFSELHPNSALVNLTLVGAKLSGVNRGGILINNVNTNTTIQNCRVLNSTISGTRVSGFAGDVMQSSTLSGCSVEGVSVTGTETAAGFVLTLSGRADSCRVIPWRADGGADYGDVTISATGAGGTAAGFASQVKGTISGSYAVGSVTAAGTAAGFAHTVSDGANPAISSSYSNCKTTGSSAAGFAYENKGTISDCYALLSVTATGSTGRSAGFVLNGGGGGSVRNCYSAARVAGGTDEYGFSQTTTGVDHGSCLYLAAGTKSGGGTKVSYDALAQSSMGNPWGAPASAPTHPYAQALQGQTYPFPMLKNMDHYGDWPGRDIQLPTLSNGEHLFGAFHYVYNQGTGLLTLSGGGLYCDQQGSKWDTDNQDNDFFDGTISFPVDATKMVGYPQEGFGVFWSDSFPVETRKQFYYNTSTDENTAHRLVGSDIQLSDQYSFIPVKDKVTALGFQHNQGGNHNNWAYGVTYQNGGFTFTE